MNDKLVLIRADELKTLISDCVSDAITKIPQPKPEEILLRRKDVAKLFSVSLVTVSAWMKSGKLPYHRINSRIFFKRSEVMAAMELPEKYRRNAK